ncbi:TIGR04338 family metallohydrolase [Rhodococcus sp. OK302]|uniref:TIGR04338 family metallohydrolase n=1 Tax=Rhodococcus sp. OK302 TaxID=1882769 RepID=UPI000B943959|nr:TIGR04338 family metallohydrolase [Rhodococcus sp. OK302]OYD67333.1 putative metallohydrolase (TIGR04338 family) [Rhodococcus sp. OK302]
MRDSQRSAVYDAETLVRSMFDRADERNLRTVEILGSSVTLPVERKFGSVESVQAYCDQALKLNWVAETCPRASVSVSVRSRAGNTAAHYSNDVIAVPIDRDGRWAMRELVVLHELAHHLGDNDEAAHGAAFVDRYLTLVGEIIGPEAAFVLRALYLSGGVQTG